MGTRGQAPKRSDQRRRMNKPELPLDHQPITNEGNTPPIPADEKWHPIARRWYESLATSGQSVYYADSDWSTAYVIAEDMSRELKPRFVGINGATGEPIVRAMPIPGGSLTALLRGFGNLMVTEGDRRRASLELQRKRGDEDAPNDDAAATLTALRGGKRAG